MLLSLKDFFLNFVDYFILLGKEKVLFCKKGVNFIYYMYVYWIFMILLNYFFYVFIFKVVFFGNIKKMYG